MQILEEMAMGEYEITTEGLFQSSAPDADYKEFLDVCNYIADVGEMNKEDKDVSFNEKSLQKATKKKPKNVAIRHRFGRFDLKHPMTPKEVSDLNIDKIIGSIFSKYKYLKGSGKWTVTTDEYGIELYRMTVMGGPIGESSFIRICVQTSKYKTETESTTFSVAIKTRTDKLMRKYNKDIVN